MWRDNQAEVFVDGWRLWGFRVEKYSLFFSCLLEPDRERRAFLAMSFSTIDRE